jgi:hypothetical protein
MATIKVMPLKFSSDNSDNPWLQLCGILKEDVSFVEWSDRFWAEKQQSVEDDEVCPLKKV